MDSLPMHSSELDQILVSPYLHLQLRGKTTLLTADKLLISGRWIFYSAVNSVTPLIVLNLGFETTAWRISVRQLSFTLMNLFVSIPIMYVRLFLIVHLNLQVVGFMQHGKRI
jgi:hypothetical protein